MFAAMEGQARVVQLLIDAGERGQADSKCHEWRQPAKSCKMWHGFSSKCWSILVLQALIWIRWTTTIARRWRLQWRAGTRPWCRQARCPLRDVHNAALWLLAAFGEEPERTLLSGVQIQTSKEANRKMRPAAHRYRHAP